MAMGLAAPAPSFLVTKSRDVSAGSRRDCVSRFSRSTISNPFAQPTQSLAFRKWIDVDSVGM
jgi:hypothetical protein